MEGTTKRAFPGPQPFPRWLGIGFWVCIVIAVAVVLRRIVALARPSQSAPPQLAQLDAAFASHAALTLAHIIPALVFVLLTPFVYLHRVERFAVLLFNSLFLFSLFRAWQLRRDPVLTLRWTTRAIAILLGIATTRPVMGIFFATSRLTHLSPQQFFGLAFWIGFSINTLFVEFWLRSQAGKSQIERIAMRPS